MTIASDIFVSAVAPLQDDADILREFVEEVGAVLDANYANYELVLIDDGSRDRTSEIVTDLLKSRKCVRYVRLSRRFGIEVAITAGLDTVIGDYVVVLHPDMDPPSLIPDMVVRARRCGGVVFGVPNARPGEPAWSRLGRRLFHGVSSGLLGFSLPKSASQFQALSRNAVNAVTRMRDKNRHLRLLSLNVGHATEVCPYDAIRRRAATRQRGVFEAFALAVRLAVSNSTRPLRILAVGGVLASAANLLWAIWRAASGSGMDAEPMQELRMMSVQTAVMSFALFLLLAALSEYIERILDESRDRPLYHVVEERNSNVVVVDADRRNVVTESTLS